MNLGEESEYVEFKFGLSQLDKGLRSLTAMLNKHMRGMVHFGVDDDGNVIGINIGRDTPDDIRSSIRQDIEPQIIADIAVHETDEGNKYITVSAVGNDVPYSYRGRYWIRNVSSDESMSPGILKSFIWSLNADPLKNTVSDVQNLTFSQLLREMDAVKSVPRASEALYDSFGFIDSEGRFNMTAYLLSDQCNAIMQIVTFDGIDRTMVSRKTDYGHKCLAVSAMEIMERIASLNITMVDMSTGKRTEKHLFDFEAFREAWINACVHNNWRCFTPPSVHVFDDRIEIQSYGSIPYGQTKEGFFEGRSKPVNPILFEIFNDLGLSERTGHGIPLIVERCGKEAFSIGDDSIVVTIPFMFEPDYVRARKESAGRSEITGRQRTILSFLTTHPEAKLSDVSDCLEIGLSVVKKEVSLLKSKNLLKNAGTNRHNRWIT